MTSPLWRALCSGRPMRLAGLLLLMSAVVPWLPACTEQSASSAGRGDNLASNGPPSVYVVNYPLQYFAERIGGAHVRVVFPVPVDADPAFWEPGVEQIRAFQQADLILLNGASYAKWAKRVSLPESRLVDTSAAFADRYMPLVDQATHSHGAAGKHQHGEVAFTTWLDPQQAISQAAAIRDALIRLRPAAESVFQRRFESLRSDLQELDIQLAAAFDAHEGQPLLFSHPVYQYLIRRYAIMGHELHWEPDSMPGPEEWRAFDKLLNEFPARWMIWEGAPKSGILAALDQRGVTTRVFDPSANRPADGDYLSVMRENLARLSGQYR
jgi:zinc transport system substrate-binding protein